jgi:hypothetical protein
MIGRVRPLLDLAHPQISSIAQEGGRYRAPLEKYTSMIKAVIGLFFFAAYE